MQKEYGMKIIVEFGEGIYYELDSSQLNPKQIELIAHMLEIPKMLEYVER
jgi:hypothetical protein